MLMWAMGDKLTLPVSLALGNVMRRMDGSSPLLSLGAVPLGRGPFASAAMRVLDADSRWLPRSGQWCGLAGPSRAR
jgi:hypothetical protein